MTYQLFSEGATAIQRERVTSSVSVGESGLSRQSFGKAVFDRVFAALALVCLSPIFLIVALMLAVAESGPVFFAHDRVGRNGRIFKCLKFRTMVPNADQRLKEALERDPALRAEWAATQKLANDPRITRLGRFLRKTSLDELPQFWNVLVGDMSVVGPRPVTEAELCRYGGEAMHYLSVRPGITGAWQTSGRSELCYQERVELDVKYVKTMSFFGDMKIVLKTVVVLAQTGAH